MKRKHDRFFRILNLIVALGAAGALSACESPYSFFASSGVQVQGASAGLNNLLPKDPAVSPSGSPGVESGGVSVDSSNGVTSVDSGGDSSDGSVVGVKDGSDGCVGDACAPASNDAAISGSVEDPVAACASLRSSELQVVSNSQTGAVIGERGRNSVNLANITEMSNDHGHFIVNANSLVQLGGDIRGNFHVYSGSVGQISDAHGFMAIINRNHAVAGANDVISEISGYRGHLLICGFNVQSLSDFHGHLRVVGGTVSNIQDARGHLDIAGGSH